MSESTARSAVLTSRQAEGDWIRGRRNRLKGFAIGCLHNPVATIAGLFLLAEALVAIFASQVTDTSPLKTSLLSRLQGPSGEHWFGTDSVGRDQFSRIIYGARATLWIAMVATVCGVLPGTILGLVTGFFGGWADLVLLRLIDTLQAFPALIMGMLIIAIMGPGAGLNFLFISVDIIVVPIAIIFMPGTSRVVRAAVLSLRNRDFIVAAQTVGGSPMRIMFRHMLPNVASSILVIGSLYFGAAILVEASLGFLGLGVQPPHPSLGGILAQEGRPHLALHPYLTVIPALVISFTVLCVNILGDTLRDILDPSLRGRL